MVYLFVIGSVTRKGDKHRIRSDYGEAESEWD